MKTMNRRSAIALGVTAAAITPLFTLAASAKAKKYGPKDGKEIAPGVRVVEVGTGNADIAAYKSISIVDVVFQPGAHAPQKCTRAPRARPTRRQIQVRWSACIALQY